VPPTLGSSDHYAIGGGLDKAATFVPQPPE
jgi:hypothetical protein